MGRGLAVRSWVGEPPESSSLEVEKMNQPLKKFRAGQVSCALWENEVMMNGEAVMLVKETDRRGRSGQSCQ